MTRELKELLVELVWFVVCAVIISGIALACCYIASNYERDAVVVSVQDGVTTFEDTTGQLWEYDTTEYSKGEEVVLHMSINGTETYFEDDIIIDVEAQ